MAENENGFIDSLLNEIADRVIKKISENNSNWLNTIQYKVRAENIEGQINASQIDDIEDMIEDVVTGKVSDIATQAAEDYVNNLIEDVVTSKVSDIATQAAEDYVSNLSFEVKVG